MLANLVARFLARRLVRWGLIALFNLIGFTSVVGIPVVLIVDILLGLAALQGIYVVLRGTAVVAGNLAAKLFRVAAIGAVICGAAGLIVAAGITVQSVLTPHTVQASAVAGSTLAATATAHGEDSAAIPAHPSAPQANEEVATQPLPDPVPALTAAQEVTRLIDEQNYAGALALIDAGADMTVPPDERTPLIALAVDQRPSYYSNPAAYRLMTKLITTNGGLDRRLNESGSIFWHQLLYDLQNNPEKFSEVLDILLARGIDINQKNFRGQTLADTATWPYINQDIMIARGACRRLPNDLKPEQSVCGQSGLAQ